MRIAAAAALVVLAAASLLVAGSALSQDEGGGKEETPAVKGADPRDHDPEEMNRRWMETMTLNRFHERLGRDVGTWDVTISLWMAPGAVPVKSRGVAEISWLLPGRWLKEEMKADMMGFQRVSVAITGYDNYKRKYVTSVVDNMTTAMITCAGNYGKDGKTLSLYGVLDEPMTGEHDKAFKAVIREIDADHRVMEIHDLSIGETDTLVMKFEYARRK